MNKNDCFLFGERHGDAQARVTAKGDDRISYHVQNEDGELSITEYSVFPGIWLTYKDAHTQRYSYPAAYPAGLLEITHCREGRYEHDTGDRFFYLSKGDLLISREMDQSTSVYCPTRHYHGLTVAIDPAAAPSCLSCFLDDVEVRPSVLLDKFCGKEPSFIIRSTPRLAQLFSELYDVPESIRKGYFKVKILELLLLLTSLDPTLSQAELRACSKSQAELAKQVCQYINDHMDVRLTIDQLAAQFYVSPAQLKKCFYSVYGESVYAYIRAYKMQSAAHQLRTTARPISQIAGAFGYDNSSKFSKAFRDVMGLSPTEYRQHTEEMEPFGAANELFGAEKHTTPLV